MKGFDSMSYPYPSQRRVIFAKNGMVATSQPLAAQAGLEILKQGGNAIDAAIATAACLTVVEPCSNGIGGDAFAIIWNKNKLHGLNASGPSPMNISDELLRKKGYQKVPVYGWAPVTVPGIPAAWANLNKKFGRLSLSKVLSPAIKYAEEGFPVSSVVSYLWQKNFQRYIKYKNEKEFRYWFETFAPKNRAPVPGEIWRCPEQAQTLQMIADTNSIDFYQGEIAEKIDAFSIKYDGYLRKEDLASFAPEWVEPISASYRGYDVWEMPPNGQGLIALMTLNILNGIDFTIKDTVESFHCQIEAMKLSFADGMKYITDYQQMSEKISDLLSSTYAEKRRKLITDQAIEPYPGEPGHSDTVYMATADNEGNMVSYIQSNLLGFGSGLVVPGTGIALQNRGASFSLDSSHANCLKPGKKTYHTILPGFITKENKAIGPFGVVGVYMQPQGHVQVLTNLIDLHLNPQAALDAPRWQWVEGKNIKVEQNFPKHIAEALERKGHIIEGGLDLAGFGRGQIILKDNQGVLMGATEPRVDGAVAAW